MDGSYSRSRGKRGHSYHDRESADSNGRHKRHMSVSSRIGPLPPQLPKFAASDTVFRILCPESKAGSVIGKGGSIIKNLRQETGAKIMIADAVPGAEDRVIVISASEADRDYSRDRERGRERDGRDRDNVSWDLDVSRDYDIRDRNNRERDARSISPAQEALFKVYLRIVEGGTLNGSDIEEDPLRMITTRLLVPNNQVGCLLGKGGEIIKHMREETKAQIRVLPRDHLPLCTLPSDEIVQIVGDLNVVKKALRMISTRLLENPPRERGQHFFSGLNRSPNHHMMPPEEVMTPHRNSMSSHTSADGHHRSLSSSFSRTEAGTGGHSGYLHRSHESGRGVSDAAWQSPATSEELTFRILCPNNKIGSIMGRGGSIIRSLQEEIGVRIRVSDAVSGSDERVVIISSVEHLDDNISPAQEALLHVQSKIADLGPDEDAVITSRLLVPSNQVGCLLGKGGNIIAEMRRLTRANIRILGKDELPNCALSNDELVQIVGDITVAREALIQVTKRLRANLCQERSFPTSGGAMAMSLGSSLSHRPGDHGSPARMHSYFPESSIHSGGRASSSYQELSPSPGHWTRQDILGGRSLAEYESPSLQPASGLFTRSAGAVVTKTTVEVVIPDHVASSIIGNGGNKIVQIRQMSGAKVNLLDVRPGASESVVEISGTPEQTHAAQSLLQAFILSGQTSSLGYAG